MFAEMGLQVERSCDRSHAENPAPFTVRVHNRESMVFVPSRRTGTICITHDSRTQVELVEHLVTLDDLMMMCTFHRHRARNASPM